jgi:glycosyltransferase involved in cell wall biosynthesis
MTSISIVIASAAGGDFLFRCLESLYRQIEGPEVEAIVVDRCGEERCLEIAQRFPSVRTLHDAGEPAPSVPQLRARGVGETRGDIVAILEEHCTVPPGWISAIRDAFQDPRVTAVGGPIQDDGYERSRDWVVYFMEYHNYLPPWPDGKWPALNGANIAYRREALAPHRDALKEGYWEISLHPKLLADEASFIASPSMVVRHTGPFDYGYYLGQRYLLSRAWGGTQRTEKGRLQRIAYLIGAPAFPLLLLGRIGGQVARSDVPFGRFIRVFPALIPAAIAYVWGEWLGYLLGPGEALGRVE